MEEVFTPADAADAATLAVKYLLLWPFVIEQVTDATEVLSKASMALLAILLQSLPVTAHFACELLDASSVELVHLLRIEHAFVLVVIVAYTTRVDLSTARSHKVALPSVVAAPIYQRFRRLAFAFAFTLFFLR